MTCEVHGKDLELVKSVLSTISLLKIQTLHSQAVSIPIGRSLILIKYHLTLQM